MRLYKGLAARLFHSAHDSATYVHIYVCVYILLWLKPHSGVYNPPALRYLKKIEFSYDKENTLLIMGREIQVYRSRRERKGGVRGDQQRRPPFFPAFLKIIIFRGHAQDLNSGVAE